MFISSSSSWNVRGGTTFVNHVSRSTAAMAHDISDEGESMGLFDRMRQAQPRHASGRSPPDMSTRRRQSHTPLPRLCTAIQSVVADWLWSRLP
jgi:hypothetical protein